MARKTQTAEGEPIRKFIMPLPDSLHHRIRVMAAERRTTMAELMREALERGLVAVERDTVNAA
jgi:hypothetical protein